MTLLELRERVDALLEEFPGDTLVAISWNCGGARTIALEVKYREEFEGWMHFVHAVEEWDGKSVPLIPIVMVVREPTDEG
jgi:hypothetical protein